MTPFDSLTRFPIIPVIVIDDPNAAEPLAEALLAGGLNIIEITFRTDAAARAIEIIAGKYPDMMVGAGTIVTADQARRAVDAGSRFALAPGTDPETISFFREKQIPFIPGVMTPSDIQVALKHGCTHLKFFPAGAAGGPKLLKAMAAPYSNRNLRFCPTGGVSIDNMNDYLSMKEVFAVGGSWLAPQDQIANQEWNTITATVQTSLKKANPAA